MPQTLALLTRTPQFDIAGSFASGQQVRKNQQDLERGEFMNRLDQLKAGEEEQRIGALQSFRNAGGMNNPAAAKELSGYPDAMMAVVKAHRELANDPAKQQRLEQTALRIANAAKAVALLPEGSPERVAEWNAQLSGLLKGGVIDQARFDQWKDRPSDLIIDQALSLGMTVDQVMKERNRQSGALTPDQQLDVEKEVNNFSKNYFGSNQYGYLTPEQVRERDGAAAQYRQELTTRLAGRGGRDTAVASPKADFGAVPTSSKDQSRLPALETTPVRTAGGGGAAANAARPTTKAEFDALPSGAPFINPADGRLLYKK